MAWSLYRFLDFALRAPLEMTGGSVVRNDRGLSRQKSSGGAWQYDDISRQGKCLRVDVTASLRANRRADAVFVSA